MTLLEKFVLKFYKESMLNHVDAAQYGFKPLSSTTCALIDIQEFVTKNLDMYAVKCVAMVAYDFSKAFDQIDHSLLLKKLLQFSSIDSNFCDWFAS